MRCIPHHAISLGLGIIFSVQAAPRLQLPVDCEPGLDCWVVNHVDVDPAQDSAADFHCGLMTYDAHKGTDIALRDRAVMHRGVDVLAAAAGTVRRVRDGMDDMPRNRQQLRKLLQADRGCGNGVFLDHGEGWRTIYCHMKQDSIVVSAGEKVVAGQRLGQVGQSGNAEFPHLHLGVTSDQQIMDPYTGLSSTDGCGAMQAPLWSQEAGLEYQPVVLYAAGFAPGPPDFDAIRRDATAAASLSREAPAFTFWSAHYGARAGDRVVLEIRGPDDSVFAQRRIVQETDRIRQYYFVGRRAPRGGLPAGTYTGTMTLSRDAEGEMLQRSVSRTVSVE